MFFEEKIRTMSNADLVQLSRKINARRYILEQELGKRQTHFNVSIFGSARVQPSDALYKEIVELAQKICMLDIHIVTGGGPGVMKAANEGAKKARPFSYNSFGVNIELPFEQSVNEFVDHASTHQLFSSRLDEFIRLSNCFIAAPGGIGTVLELMYMWQLVQVGMMHNKKILLFKRDHWQGLIDWISKVFVDHEFIKPQDLDLVEFVDDADEAFTIVEREFLNFKLRKEKGRVEGQLEQIGADDLLDTI